MTCGLCKQPIKGDERYVTDHYTCAADLHQSFRNDIEALTKEMVEWITAWKALVLLARDSRRQHYHCDDSYYCCPRCTSDDHGYPSSDKPCDCGADEWNSRVDAVLNVRKET